MVPFLLWKSACIKFSTKADILSCKMIMENDITILFSDLVSLIVPLQTLNVKYYKYVKSLIIEIACYSKRPSINKGEYLI